MSVQTRREESRIAISTTYPEAALLATARAAARRGLLGQLFTTLRSTRRAERLAACAPLSRIREPLQRELIRRSFSGVPAAALVTVAAGDDLLQRGARLLPRSEALAQRLEYRLKERFDNSVAGLLGATDSTTVIAMFASAEETLYAARKSDRRGVLHLVNNHPAYRNRFLRELAHLPATHHELVPAAIEAKVQRELEFADLVLVPSRGMVRQLQACGIPSENVVLQPYGVDPTAFRPARNERTAQGRGQLRCLFVGTISHGKGVQFLVEAARRLRRSPVRFLLIGPLRAPELLRDMPDNVEWRSGATHEEVSEAMRSADVFVLPSIDDAYPLVTLEAMASGLPVIVSDHTGTSELLTPGVDGLIVTAGRTDALLTAIERLLEDADARRSIGSAARRKVERGLSWDAYGDAVLDRLQGSVSPVLQPRLQGLHA